MVSPASAFAGAKRAVGGRQGAASTISTLPSIAGCSVERKLSMIYWKGDHFWLGKLVEHPEIMTQGETLEELKVNLKDAFRLIALDDVADDYQ
jgi:hypothetical protein